MKQRKLGSQGLAGFGDRARLLRHERRLRRAGRRRIDQDHPPRHRARHQPVRHVRRLQRRQERTAGRRRASRESATRSVIASKFGNVRGPNGERGGVNGKPEYVPVACEASLKRLGIDVIDLYYQHRIDQERADRGHGRRHVAPRRAGQGALPRPVRGRRGDDPPRAQDPSARRAGNRVFAVDARHRDRRSCRPCASSASASSPIRRSAAASSPARSRSATI